MILLSFGYGVARAPSFGLLAYGEGSFYAKYTRVTLPCYHFAARPPPPAILGVGSSFLASKLQLNKTGKGPRAPLPSTNSSSCLSVSIVNSSFVRHEASLFAGHTTLCPGSLVEPDTHSGLICRPILRW